MYFIRFFILLIAVSAIHAARILCIFPTVSKSHFIVASILCNSLGAEGHIVTIISPYSTKEKVHNSHSIQINVTENDNSDDTTKCPTDDPNPKIESVWEDQLSTYCNGLLYTNLTFQDCTIRKLINSNKKFDLIIMDASSNDALLGFGHKFSAPVVVVSMTGATSWTYTMGGIVPPLSMVPNHFLGYYGKMTIIERILNILMSTYDQIIHYSYIKEHKILFNEYFPNSRITLDELRANISLILLNDHFTLSYPKPYMPNMIEVGGLHIKPEPDRLPSDIESFINSTADGFIYFSMGTDLESNFSTEKLEHIIKAFGCIKQKILWKYEEQVLFGVSDNVMIRKWFPQQDILAHKNIQMLITNGGTLSLMESIYYKVPVIGIPVRRNHMLNMERAVKAGYAIIIDYDKLSSLRLGTAINNILQNPKYKQKITELNEKFVDQPLPPLENAIYWIEYVLRHSGAQHLKSITKNFSFIEYYNLDAYFILTVLVLLLIHPIKKLFNKAYRKMTNKGQYDHRMYPHQRFAYQ